MKRLSIALISVALGAAALIGIQAMTGATAPGPAVGPVAAHDPSVPKETPDLGVGERLILVVGGIYPSQADAEEANAALNFGDIQGFYVTQIANFDGLRPQLPGKGGWALVSAFRTQEAAEAFAGIAQVAGAAHPIITPRVVSLGMSYAGLGQEADPDGSGPLEHAVRASKPIAP